MALLRKAQMQTSRMKMGIYGFQGSGKTYTASRVISGLLKFAKVENPKLAIFDTEKSSDFLVEYFAKEQIELLVVKSRAFKDLVDAIKEAEGAGVHAFMVDSVTHVWRDLCRSFELKLNRRQGLALSDWATVKAEWSRFTDLFINSPMHFFAIGRAGIDWGEEKDEAGKSKLIAEGTKMKAEGEFGYESDILVEMELMHNQKTDSKFHRLWVIKDRWDVINGKYFDNPTFANFLPVVQKFNLTTEHFGFDQSRDSQDIFGNPDFSVFEARKQREIALEELQAMLAKLDLGGTAQETQKKRIVLLEKVFGTSSKTAIEQLWGPAIREGMDKLLILATEAKEGSNGKASG